MRTDAKNALARREPHRLLTCAWFAAMLPGCYLAHVTSGQLGVIKDAIEAEEALLRAELSDTDKEKLRYISEVKRFAETEIGLKPTCNFSTYLLRERKPLTWTVIAVRRDSFEPKTWWFPIVGIASYKGFFDESMAFAERDGLRDAGYDAVVWPAGAYSTLDWFCDPVLPTMLDYGNAKLADLIIHELTHGTIYVSGDTEFNESLADFVAHAASPIFLERKFGPGNAADGSFAADLAAEAKMNKAIRQLYERLAAIYDAAAAEPGHGNDKPTDARRDADMSAAREREFSAARKEFAAICAETGRIDALCTADSQLDNAVIYSRLAYGSPERFQKLFDAVGHDWHRFWQELRARYDRPDWYPPADERPKNWP